VNKTHIKMARRINENGIFLEVALKGFLVIITVIVFFNCVPWLKW
jgi:hypothetical protein